MENERGCTILSLKRERMHDPLSREYEYAPRGVVYG
jgi:hypothetical protein